MTTLSSDSKKLMDFLADIVTDEVIENVNTNKHIRSTGHNHQSHGGGNRLVPVGERKPFAARKAAAGNYSANTVCDAGTD